MTHRGQYAPGPASAVRVLKDGEAKWTLVLVRELRHAPAKVWRALTEPEQLREWAPYDADRNLDAVGAAKLRWVGAPKDYVANTTVTRAEAPRVLEYDDIKWELEPSDMGTRLTLWASIDRRYISMGTSGWHICLDVLHHLLDGAPIGRIAGPAAMEVEGWVALNREYAKQIGGEDPRSSK